MAFAPAADRASAVRLPFRLRTLLWVALLALTAYSLVPRALAFYRVHALATAVADYALCMVGPTGPGSFRDNPEDFVRLVHRRIVAAAPSERPFERCRMLALTVSKSADAAAKHALPAASFAEYGLSGTETAAGLAVTNEPLRELARAAWPFARGYTALVKPSLGAFEAVHPVGFSLPGVGRGIPAGRGVYRSLKRTADALWLAFGAGARVATFKSTDNGLTFRAAAVPASDFAERCSVADGRAYEVGPSADRDVLEVTSIDLDGTAHATPLAGLPPQTATPLAVACDERSAVVMVRAATAVAANVFLCPFAGRCAPLPGPRGDVIPSLYERTLDIARVHGTTVLAVTTKGVVRVSSSRDEGRSWTPFYVAFDIAEHPEVRVDVSTPSYLLSVDNRVLLYGGSHRAAQSYSLLVSDDHGASFRTP